MAKYREATISGSSYTRYHRLVLLNDVESPPSFNFQEQEVVDLGAGTVITRPMAGIGVHVTEANARTKFPVVDLVTGKSLGTATYQDALNILQALYLSIAAERDAKDIQTGPKPVPPGA